MSKNISRPSSNRNSSTIKWLLRDERGMSTVEYVILMAFIIVGAIGTWKTIGDNVQTSLEKARDESNELNK